MTGLLVLHKGATSDAAKRLQAATNKRLAARNIDMHLACDGQVGPRTLLAVRKAAWILGAESRTYDAVTKTGRVSVGVQQMILTPGKRTKAQLSRGKARQTALTADRKRRARELEQASGARKRIVELAQEAAANYRRNPGAYHYLAGGVANTIFLKPTPRNYRSDCSQFVASVYKAAGVESPAKPLDHQWASTLSIESSPHTSVTTKPRPGDLGMYGPHGRTHHVELYCGVPGQEFIGHGSPPIDSLTPGRPDFYLTCDFLA